MKRFTLFLTLLAVSAFTAPPALAKGGHSGGHSHSSGGHAHSSGGHAHHSVPHAAHQSAPHAAHKPATNRSTSHVAHQAAGKVARHPTSNATRNASREPNPVVAGGSNSQATKHQVHRPYQSAGPTSNPATSAQVSSNPATSNPANPTPSRGQLTVNQARVPVIVAGHYSHYGMRHRYYNSRHGRYYSRRRMRANQAPSFVKGPDQVVAVNAGPQVVTPWATHISAGRGNRSGGGLSFQVTGDTRPGLFQTVPSVSPSGTLSYTPAPGQTGTATITLVLRNHSAAPGGHNTSRPQSFHITVVAT
jgi:hypothetical protein